MIAFALLYLCMKFHWSKPLVHNVTLGNGIFCTGNAKVSMVVRIGWSSQLMNRVLVTRTENVQNKVKTTPQRHLSRHLLDGAKYWIPWMLHSSQNF